MYAYFKEEIRFFLAHHGGPDWKDKDNSWDIPKGEVEEDESDLLEVAKREFYEETGIFIDKKDFMSLGNFIDKFGKTIYIWAFEGSGNEVFLGSNNFQMEWPIGSKNFNTFPEMDEARYFDVKEAKTWGHSYVPIFIERLLVKL